MKLLSIRQRRSVLTFAVSLSARNVSVLPLGLLPVHSIAVPSLQSDTDSAVHKGARLSSVPLTVSVPVLRFVTARRSSRSPLHPTISGLQRVRDASACQIQAKLLDHLSSCRRASCTQSAFQTFQKLADFGTPSPHVQHRGGKDSVQIDAGPEAQLPRQDVTTAHDLQRRFDPDRTQRLAQFLDRRFEVLDGLRRRVTVP